jgi:hypothetical protein
MAATVPQATAVVTAITALQASLADIITATGRAQRSNGPVSPGMQAALTSLNTDLAAALVLANVVLTNTP